MTSSRGEFRFRPTRTSPRSEEHTSEPQSPCNLVCRLLLEKKKKFPEHCRSVRRRLVPRGHRRHIAERRGHSRAGRRWRLLFFFFNDTATTEIYTLSLHDALPI